MFSTIAASTPIRGRKMITPPTLNPVWIAAARRASRGLPIVARSAVTDVPMFAPRIRAMPASSGMRP